MSKPLEYWLWTITDPFTNRRRQISYRMTEATARKRFGKDALKVEDSLEVRRALADFLQQAKHAAQNGDQANQGNHRDSH